MNIENKIENRRVIATENIVKCIKEKSVKEGDIFNRNNGKLVVNIKYPGRYTITTITSVVVNNDSEYDNDSKRIIERKYYIENENSICVKPKVIRYSDNNFKEYFDKLKEGGLLK